MNLKMQFIKDNKKIELSNKEKLLKEISLMALSNVQKNIASNIKPENSPLTKAVKQGDKTLRDTGALMSSLHARTEKNTAIVATALPYAAIQNSGGEIKPVRAKYLYLPASKDVRTLMRRYGFSVPSVINGLRADGFSVWRQKDSRVVWYKSKKSRNKPKPLFFLKSSVKIPKREFMFLSEPTVEKIQQLLEVNC